MLASEVLELVLYLLQLQIDPLDNLDLDEFFEVVVVAGADEEDQLDVGLLGGVEGLPVFGLEAVLHRDDLGVLEAEHLRDDVLGLRRRVGDDGAPEEVFEVLDGRHCVGLLALGQFGFLLFDVTEQFGAAPVVLLDACEQEVLFLHELAVDELFEEELFDVRVDLVAVLDAVFEETAVEVGLRDPVGGLEVLLLAHGFGEFCLFVALGLVDLAEEVGFVFLESLLSLELADFGFEVFDLFE